MMHSPELPPDPNDMYDSLYDHENSVSYTNLQPIFPATTPLTPSLVFENLSLNSASNEDMSPMIPDMWMTKPPHMWSPSEVIEWLFTWAKQSDTDMLDVNTRELHGLSGQDLCQMGHATFCAIDSRYGTSLYDCLQSYINQHRQPSMMTEVASSMRQDHIIPEFHDWASDSYFQCQSALGDHDAPTGSPISGTESDGEERESTSSSLSTVNEKSLGVYPLLPTDCIQPIRDSDYRNEPKKGRPPTNSKARSRQGKGTGKLWEFIRDLLLDPSTNPSLIRWERREEGIFKFVQSDRVAKMWGDRKQNPKMTYEKLSRAMRTYYGSDILLRVPKNEGLPKKLVYQFGPRVMGMRR